MYTIMWSYEGNSTEEDKKVEDKFLHFFENEKVSRGFARFWSLYMYLKKNPPTDASLLRKSVFMDKAGVIPFFDEDSSEKVVKLWKIVHNPAMFSEYMMDKFKNVKKVGGAKSSSSDVDKVATEIAGVATSFVPTEGILGKVASTAGWVVSLPSNVIVWITENPYIGGPIWLAAINLYLKIIPKIVLLMQTSTPLIATPLIPLFGIGFVVFVVSFVVSSFLILTTVFLALAMKRPGTAFVNFLSIIPFIGIPLKLIVGSAVDVYTEVRNNILPLIYGKQPQQVQANVGRGRKTTRRRHRRRTHKQFENVGRTRR
jgi:hypothetical protein